MVWLNFAIHIKVTMKTNMVRDDLFNNAQFWHTGQWFVVEDRPGSHLGLRSRFDLAPKRLESRLSHQRMTRLDLKFS